MEKEATTCLLTKETSLCLKGYFAISVLIHHLYQFSGILNNTYVGYIFILLGRWAALGFAFLTGYGLYSSYKKGGNNYIRLFPRKRILTHYVTYLFFFLLYVPFVLAQGEKITFAKIISSLTIGGTIISFGWYLQAATVMYIVFWVAFRFFKNPKIRSVIMLILIAAYIAFSILTNVIYYIPSLMLVYVFGIICSIHEMSIIRILSEHKVAITLVSFFLFGFFSIVFMSQSIFTISLQPVIVDYVIGNLAAVFEMITIIAFIFNPGKKFRVIIINRVSRFLGKCSLEIYCCQGLVLGTLFLLAANKYLLSVISLVLVLCISAVLNLVIVKIRSLILKNA